MILFPQTFCPLCMSLAIASYDRIMDFISVKQSNLLENINVSDFNN